MSDEVLINPPSGPIGDRNAILSGITRYYDVRRFAGPLSLKSVVRGRATWTTGAGSFVVDPGAALIVHEGEEYDIAIDALQPVETFCIFFAPRFVEDALQSATTSSAALLDAPPPERRIEFPERLLYALPVVESLIAAHGSMRAGEPVAETIAGVASALVHAACDVDARVARLPALRSSTREELRRRIARGTDYIHANIDRALPLAEVAGAACLSPFHFHRLFSAFHGEPPHRYITRVRLARACALLRGERSVTEVAMECGFESVGSFTTLFTRRFGQPPARFRKNEEAAASRAH
ncbi:MAG TPA: AraC family transcriptional regulator [Thermoanaerobaculia bacterium]